MGSLEEFQGRADHSWLRDLEEDPEREKNAPNKDSREVKSGHFVRVRPTPLPNPYLVAVSPAMCSELGLSVEACQTDPRFVKFFSGDANVLSQFETWATPYALSIFGSEMYRNCPFGNGNGYGDGRAISVGEVVVNGKRWEMQLKGGGRTPFCRGADGRAVLRSSVREFLASEAMHHLGVATTRALSLVATKNEGVVRPWYSSKPQEAEADGFMAMFMGRGGNDPDIQQKEPCAITCRVAPSFLRIGHLELFGRRARKSSASLRQLELIVKHAIDREYPEIAAASEATGAVPEAVDYSKMKVKDLKSECALRGVNVVGLTEKSELVDALSKAPMRTGPSQAQVLALTRAIATRLACLASNWLRVGFCQGNFNSDNCLVAGRTMDYGPFGFLEEFNPKWCMWVGGGGHFAFGNQAQAARVNLKSALQALTPLLDAEGAKQVTAFFEDETPRIFDDAVNDMWRQKLGLAAWDAEAQEMHKELGQLMERDAADYTMFWRQLADLTPQVASVAGEKPSNTVLLAPLVSVFGKPLSESAEESWVTWIWKWLAKVAVENRGAEAVAAGMRDVSPKYVPREWMLVEAYDEQEEKTARWYRKVPAERKKCGGINFMS
eukprot:TRINITY_DN26547_c0_g1_i2.p1 TRINITY_DN26547_c0_g1~~TRINITY_DN26547_c0_g1_i2.p1  ORF type:complete len:609 (+),score=111.53 TRINITY_DN26547_c0_g1_i2:88-1914(+)